MQLKNQRSCNLYSNTSKSKDDQLFVMVLVKFNQTPLHLILHLKKMH